MRNILDHENGKVKRIQFYVRLFEKEEDILNKHIKKMKKLDKRINKSRWLRRAILDKIIRERKRDSSKGVEEKTTIPNKVNSIHLKEGIHF